MRDDLADIKQGLKDRIEPLCRRLLPDGRRQGRLWVAYNPVTSDHARSTPEFKVALDRDIGAWIDYRSGEKGDVIRLVEYCTGCNFKDALAFARDFLGISSMTASQRATLQHRAQDAAKDAERKQAEQRLKRMAAAESLWHTGYADGANSTAESFARRYFAARKIPLENIPSRDTATMRFAAETEYWPRAQYRYEGRRRIKIAAGPMFPAVLSSMRLPTGQVSAVHATFLDPLGPRKLPVAEKENAKLMFGEAKGAVMRISHGPEGEPPETATQAHPLILGEGIETVVSMAIEAPEARAWAAGSLSNMANAPVWLPCVSAVVLLKDHFKHKATEDQWDKVLEAMARCGKPVVETDSHIGNDFNDLMQEGPNDDDEG